MKNALVRLQYLLSRSATFVIAGIAAVALIALLAFSALGVMMIAAVVGLTGLLLARLHGHQPAQQRATVLDARLSSNGRWEIDHDAR
jgi:hypothetical protein